MSKVLDLGKSVHDLAAQYPDFIDVMVGLGFSDIAKPAALNTVGRVMTVPRGAAIKGISLDDAVRAFEEAGFEVVGARADGAPEPDGKESPSPLDGTADARVTSDEDGQKSATSTPNEASSPAGQSRAEKATENPASTELDEAGRARLLESYVARLSAGEDLESVRADFVAHFQDVDAAEIARAEQTLIDGGAKISDVQRLCDVHSALFHGATREERIANAERAVTDSLTTGSGAGDFQTRVLAALPGHPVYQLTRENEAISRQIARARKALGTDSATTELARLRQVGIHYAKKGDLLYPILKTRHGFSGPADVMWGVDDEIKAELAAVATAREHDAAWRERAERVLTRAEEMVYKETNILLPLCVKNFTDDEWLQTYRDMKGYDLCLIDDAGTWQTGEEFCSSQEEAAPTEVRGADEVRLPTGHLTAAQLDAMLNTIPLEITFIDDREVNRYWNDDGRKKLFKRPASALDREVWSCHPPKVEPMVRSVIASLKSGERDSVDIWMQKEGEPVLVRYMAVRDRNGSYVGTMECIQRMRFAEEHFQK